MDKMDKILKIINDESVIKFSDHMFDMDLNCVSGEDKEVTKKLIEEKLENNHKKGICCCDDDYLCEHRKEYFIKALYSLM